MSTDALNRAWHSKSGGTTKLVLIALADWSDRWGYCYPSMRWIADRANIAQRSVYRHLSELVAMGDIRLLRSGGGNPGMTNVYHLRIGLSDSEIAQSESESPIAKKVLAETHVTLSGVEKASVKFDKRSTRGDSLSGVEKQSVIYDTPSKTGDNLSGECIASILDRLTISFKRAAEESSANLSGVSICQGLESENEDEKLKSIVIGLLKIGWRGTLDDVAKAYEDDPERVCQWIWFAHENGWKNKGGLFRTILRSPGEYPVETSPDSEKSRERYFNGDFADYVNH